jgi:nucleotide-binding universal stress UspA family protein
MSFRHILVATDFGEAAERATDIAVGLALQSGARITLVHAHSMPQTGSAEGVSVPPRQNERVSGDALGEALARLRRRWPKSDALLLCGVPWEQILLAIETRGADLVVMGTHGRRGIQRALLGSVAETVLRRSPVPVLTAASARAQRTAA